MGGANGDGRPDAGLASHWPIMKFPVASSSVLLWPARWLQQPALMLLDEPFSALDTGLRARHAKRRRTCWPRRGSPSILVTHDQNEALSFATRVAVMRQGRFAQLEPR